MRSHGAPETYTLEDYRIRYSLYKSDPDLAAAHAACPWLVTWDDHEVDNDYAGDVSEENDSPELFLARRAAAYRAYYEHMPLPRRAVPFGANMRLLRSVHSAVWPRCFCWTSGSTARRRFARHPAVAGALASPKMRGDQRSVAERCSANSQEEWLHASLAQSGARWNLLAQGTVMAYLDEDPGPGRTVLDRCLERLPRPRVSVLYDVLAERRVPNPVVLSGDIHAFVVSRLNREAGEICESPVIGSGARHHIDLDAGRAAEDGRRLAQRQSGHPAVE